MSYVIEVFYDGQCPLCVREMRWLQHKDRAHGRIVFTDITANQFDAASLGVSMGTLMQKIHGRLPDGSIVVGVEVFRRLYGALGFTWAVKVSRLPGVKQCLDVLYTLFARNRMRLTGRCSAGHCKNS
jgi:predicted DCC family thiol-disulfide oxidoreductase YuxK